MLLQAYPRSAFGAALTDRACAQTPSTDIEILVQQPRRVTELLLRPQLDFDRDNLTILGEREFEAIRRRLEVAE